MEAGITLIVILVIGVPLILGIWLIVRAVQARRSIEELAKRLQDAELEIHQLIATHRETTTAEPPLAPTPAKPIPTKAEIFRTELETVVPIPPVPAPAMRPTPIPPPIIPKPAPSVPHTPPPLPVFSKAAPTPRPALKVASPINWE